MPFAPPIGFGGALTDPPSLFGEIARMIKTISPGNVLSGGRKNMKGLIDQVIELIYIL